jgi:hypothetical protein
VSESRTETTRRYYWACPRCYEYVPRARERCACGGTKAERKEAHARVRAAAPPNGWWIAAWLSLGTFGALWVMLE